MVTIAVFLSRCAIWRVAYGRASTVDEIRLDWQGSSDAMRVDKPGRRSGGAQLLYALAAQK
jgi:hypothetical protein